MLILNEDEIHLIERTLYKTNKLIGLLTHPDSPFSSVEDNDCKEMVKGLKDLKNGCEITLKIQKGFDCDRELQKCLF